MAQEPVSSLPGPSWSYSFHFAPLRVRHFLACPGELQSHKDRTGDPLSQRLEDPACSQHPEKGEGTELHKIQRSLRPGYLRAK